MRDLYVYVCVGEGGRREREIEEEGKGRKGGREEEGEGGESGPNEGGMILLPPPPNFPWLRSLESGLFPSVCPAHISLAYFQPCSQGPGLGCWPPCPTDASPGWNSDSDHLWPLNL